MCMFCSAFCENCKPAEQRVVFCPSCGKATILTREDCLYSLGYWKKPAAEQEQGTDANICSKCGTGLDETVKGDITPQDCQYSNIRCGYPCRRRDRPRGANDDPCVKQVIAR